MHFSVLLHSRHFLKLFAILHFSESPFSKKFSGYFYYANSAVNPVLYNALNARFRHAFVQTLDVCTRSSKSDSQQQQILEVSGCLRSSCSNAAAFSNPKLSAACGPAASALNRSGSDDPKRRFSVSSQRAAVGRLRSESRGPKLSLLSATGCEERHHLRPRCPSASMGSLATAAAKANRRRSSGGGLLKPPLPQNMKLRRK